MKKILALALALVLALTAVAAVAEEEAALSITQEDLLSVEVVDRTDVTVTVMKTKNEVVDEFLATLEAAAKDENVNVAENLPEQAKAALAAALPENTPVSTVTAVDEVAWLKLNKSSAAGTAEDAPLVLNMKFATSFADKKIYVLVGLVTPEGIIEWVGVPATVQEDGSINIELDAQTQAWLGDNEFLVLIMA